MGYLDLFVKSIGAYSYIEVPTGTGRLDIVILFRNKKYVIETKIWGGQRKFIEAKEQLTSYLASENVNEGYLVFFDPRDKDFREFKENKFFEGEYYHKRITTFIINIRRNFNIYRGTTN